MSSVIPRDLEQTSERPRVSVFRLDYYMTPRMRPSAASVIRAMDFLNPTGPPKKKG